MSSFSDFISKLKLFFKRKEREDRRKENKRKNEQIK